jgi:L-threonylcarbamoyladenylate synthase
VTRVLDLRETAEAAGILMSGGIVAVPTETVYGLAAVATNAGAVARVFEAKGRPSDHPLIVHVDSLEMATRFGMMNDTAVRLAHRFWPGPLTLLVERTPLTGDNISGGRDTVALRMPDHDATLAVIHACGDGLVAPSANSFGHVSPTTARHVIADLDGVIDAVLDGGACSVGVESTIVDCTDDVQILRPGAVTRADIEGCLGITVGETAGPSRAPGMLRSHYAPRCRVHLVGNQTEAHECATRLGNDTAGVIIIGTGLDPATYAARLYGLLRQGDDPSVTDLVAIVPQGSGIEEAIRDRLTKAAADSAA